MEQFVCAANWMRSCIPRFTTAIAPLAEVVEKVYATAGRRTRKAAEKVKLLETQLTKQHLEAFKSLQHALHHATTLAHPHPGKSFCLFTDASSLHWSGALTQIPLEDADIPFQGQRHEPLSFLSGSFKGSIATRSTAEQEGFAIVESVTRLGYILLRPQVS